VCVCERAGLMENGDAEEREIAVGKGQNFPHVIRNTAHDKYAPNLSYKKKNAPNLTFSTFESYPYYPLNNWKAPLTSLYVSAHWK